MRWLLALLILVELPAWTPPAAARPDCAGILDDAARLACYDAAWRAPGQGAPDWSVREVGSAFDAGRGVVATRDAEAPFTDRFGELVRARLGLACRNGGQQVWVHFGGAYLSDRVPDGGGQAVAAGPRMLYRLDAAEPVLREFQVANDRRALGFWTDRAARLFLAELEGHRRLVVRATPFRTATVTVAFDLSGLAAPLRRVRAACTD